MIERNLKIIADISQQIVSLSYQIRDGMCKWLYDIIGIGFDLLHLFL